MNAWHKAFLASTARLLGPKARVVVGTSGGPDSQTLLHLLSTYAKELNIEALWAVGIHHGLRAEAAGELKLAEQLATQLGVPFTSVAVQVDRKGNLLDAARRVRYAALLKFAGEQHCNAVAVAHTATDQMETILLHLLRGCGLGGSRGMARRRGKIVRPLLAWSRREILDYVRTTGLSFANDPSNSDPRRARAVLRQQVTPGLTSLSGRPETGFSRYGRLAAADEQYLEELAMAELDRRKGPIGSLALHDFAALPFPISSRVLRLWLRRHHQKAGYRASVALAAATGSLWRTGHQRVGGLWIEHGFLWTTAKPERYAHDFAAPGRLAIAQLDLTLVAKVGRSRRIAKGSGCIALDASKEHLPLRVRPWRQGDRIRPFGLNGHIKVGDLFTNRKIPRALRRLWPVVLCGDEIVWVVGLRRGAMAPITPKTRRILTIAVEGQLPWSA